MIWLMIGIEESHFWGHMVIVEAQTRVLQKKIDLKGGLQVSSKYSFLNMDEWLC